MLHKSEDRTLPNCIIIGVAKGGTTALYRYLGEHPEIYMSALKEINYFAYSDNEGRVSGRSFPVTTLEAYRGLFSDGSEYKVRGEASPSYFGCASSPGRIHELIPDAKLIISLRNPVDRAFSGYQMQVRANVERRPIQEAFTEDALFVRVSFYYENLKRYFDTFSKEQIHVLLFDDLKKNTLGSVQSIFRFLDVDPTFCPDTEVRHNKGSIPKNKAINAMLVRAYQLFGSVTPTTLRRLAVQFRDRNLGPAPELPCEIRQRLAALYRDDILRVQDLIQYDLSAWLGVD